VDLLDAVVAGLSWTDARLAREVGVDANSVGRWRSTGVPNSYLPALRALRDAARDPPRRFGYRPSAAVGQPLPA
jgi:hypothetical protein